MAEQAQPEKSSYGLLIFGTCVFLLILFFSPLPVNDPSIEIGKRVFLFIGFMLVSPSIFRNIASTGWLLDSNYNNNAWYIFGELFLSLSVTVNQILRVIPKNPYAADHYHNLNALGLHYCLYRKSDKAEALFKDLIALIEKEKGECCPELIEPWLQLIGVYRDSGKFDDCQTAIEKFQFLIDKYSDQIELRDVSAGLCDACILLAKRGHQKESIQMADKALSLLDRVRDEFYRENMRPVTINNVAIVYAFGNQYSKAELLMKQQAELSYEKFGDNDLRTSRAYNNLTWVLNCQYKYEEALQYGEKAKAIVERNAKPDSIEYIYAVSNYADSLVGLKRVEEAKPILLKTFEQKLEILKTVDPDLASTYRSMGFLFAECKDTPKATTYFQKAVTMLSDCFPADHPKIKQWRKEAEDLNISLEE